MKQFDMDSGERKKPEKPERLQDVRVCGITALVVLLIYVVILGGAWLAYGKERVFLFGDALVQYVHVIRMFYRHLLEGGSLNYSFELGMGMPTRAIYAYYTLSPFDLVFLPVKDPNLAGCCLVGLKLIMAGAMFALLLRKTLKTDLVVTLVCSIGYAFCGYAMVFSYGYVLQDCVYLMPILVLGIMGFVRDGRWRGLCLIYALSFGIQFYIGYMISVFSVVLLLVLLCEKCGKKGELWKYYIVRYLCCVLTAIILSAPVTLPAALELFSHMGTDATELKPLTLLPWELFAGLYPGHIEDVYNHMPMIYCGMPAVLLSIRFFLNPEQGKKEKRILLLLLLFLLLTTFFPPLYLLVHAFDAPDGYCYRFSWIYSFWMLYVSAMELRVSRKQIGGWRAVLPSVAVGAGYFVIYALMRFFSEEKYRILSINTGVVCLIMLGIYTALLLLWGKQKKFRVLFLLLFAAELIWNGNMVQTYNAKNPTNDREYYGIWQEQAETAMDFIRTQEETDPWPFYRVRNSNCLTDNISMLYGYRGLGYFSTIEHEAVRKVLGSLGYSTSPRVVQDYGSMPFTRMLFAQKYSLECAFWRGEQRGQYMLTRNERVLPVAFMASQEIKELHLDSHNPFENQSRLAGALTGEDVALYSEYSGGYAIEADGVEIATTEDGFLLQKQDTEDGVGIVYYTFRPEEGKKLYVYVSKYGNSGNSASPAIFSKEDIGGMLNYSVMDMPHILPLAAEEDGTACLYISMVDLYENAQDYETIYASYENDAELEKTYRTLRAGGMEVTEAEDDCIRGRVVATQERPVVFTSIPYEKGWKVTVDGVDTQAFAVLDGAFLAVQLSPGEHEVCFRYENPWVLPAYLLGILGWGLFLLFSKALKERRLLDTEGGRM